MVNANEPRITLIGWVNEFLFGWVGSFREVVHPQPMGVIESILLCLAWQDYRSKCKGDTIVWRDNMNVTRGNLPAVAWWGEQILRGLID